jgi:hypothetical protein
VRRGDQRGGRIFHAQRKNQSQCSSLDFITELNCSYRKCGLQLLLFHSSINVSRVAKSNELGWSYDAS